MTPEERIKTALESVDGLRGKVFPLEGLKNAAPDFVFYLRLTEDEESALDGPTGLQSGAFEINCVSRSFAGLVALGGAVWPVLRALQGTVVEGLHIERATIRQSSPDIKEKEVNLFRRMYVLELNYQKEEK